MLCEAYEVTHDSECIQNGVSEFSLDLPGSPGNSLAILR